MIDWYQNREFKLLASYENCVYSYLCSGSCVRLVKGRTIRIVVTAKYCQHHEVKCKTSVGISTISVIALLAYVEYYSHVLCYVCFPSFSANDNISRLVIKKCFMNWSWSYLAASLFPSSHQTILTPSIVLFHLLDWKLIQHVVYVHIVSDEIIR